MINQAGKPHAAGGEGTNDMTIIHGVAVERRLDRGGTRGRSASSLSTVLFIDKKNIVE